MKKKLKLGSKLWVQKGDLLFEVKVSYVNHGDYWASPTTEDPREGHYIGCVTMKIDSKGREIFF